MHDLMSSPLGDFKVVGAIVSLVTVTVMDNISFREWPAQQFRSHQPVFVDVPILVSQWMARDSQDDVAMSGYESALPSRVAWPFGMFGAHRKTAQSEHFPNHRSSDAEGLPNLLQCVALLVKVVHASRLFIVAWGRHIRIVSKGYPVLQEACSVD